MTNSLDRLREDIIKGYDDRVVEDLKLVLDEGSSPLQVINSCLVPAIIDVGIMWNAGDYYLPDVILSVEAFKAVSAPLEELLKRQKERAIGRVVIGVVEGDAHDLGKDIVAALLMAAGFEVRDLGLNVSTQAFLSAVRESRPNILALGAYMSTTVFSIREVMKALNDAMLRQAVKVMVGGIPISRRIARQMGADGYGEDALEAVACAKRLVGVEDTGNSAFLNRSHGMGSLTGRRVR